MNNRASALSFTAQTNWAIMDVLAFFEKQYFRRLPPNASGRTCQSRALFLEARETRVAHVPVSVRALVRARAPAQTRTGKRSTYTGCVI
jgi:hypothetical protein